MNETDGAQQTFPAVLSRAVEARGLSLDRIRARLEAAGVPVSNATLSYWQSGRSLPTRARSLRTLVELEAILHLEPGTLTDLIRRPDGRTRHELFPWQSVVPAGELAEQIIAEMGMEGAGRVSRISVHDTLTLDADGLESSYLVRQVLRAERNGVRNFPIVFQQDGGGGPLEVEGIFGCHAANVVDVPERNLMVAEMALSRPLRRGELVLTEHLLTLRPSPSSIMTRSFPEPLRELVLAVQFHPKKLAAQVTGFSRPSIDPEAPESDVVSVPVIGDQTQLVRLDVPPGVHGLRWTW